MEKVVLKTLLTNEHFATAVFTYIKDDFFENEYKQVWNIFSKVYSEHQIVPSTDILKYEVEQLQVKSQVKDNINSFIDEAFSSPVPDKVLPYLIPKTEAWGLERMVYNAIVNGIAEFDSDKKDFGKIHDELRKAISYSFDSSVGMSYFLDAEARYKEYMLKVNKKSFGINLLDDNTDGGYEDGTLNIFVAGCVHPDTLVEVVIVKKSKPN